MTRRNEEFKKVMWLFCSVYWSNKDLPKGIICIRSCLILAAVFNIPTFFIFSILSSLCGLFCKVPVAIGQVQLWIETTYCRFSSGSFIVITVYSLYYMFFQSFIHKIFSTNASNGGKTIKDILDSSGEYQGTSPTFSFFRQNFIGSVWWNINDSDV